MCGNVRRRALALGIPVLNVLGDRDMRDGAIAERGLDRFVHDIDDMIRSGNTLVVGGDIHVELVEIDVLLVVGADQIMKRVARDGEHGLPVAFRIVEAVEQMNAAGPGRRKAHAETAGVFCIAAGGEGCGLFVPDLDKSDLFLIRPQRLENSIHAIAGKTENRFDAPLDEAFHQ